MKFVFSLDFIKTKYLYSISAELFTRIVKYFTLIFAINLLGNIEYGTYAYCFAIASFFSILIDAGTQSSISQKIVSKEGIKEEQIGEILLYKIFIYLISAISSTLLMIINSDNSNTILLTAFCTLYLIINDIIQIFLSIQRTIGNFISEAIYKTLTALAVSFLSLVFLSIYKSAIVYIIFQIIPLITILIYIYIKTSQNINYFFLVKRNTVNLYTTFKKEYYLLILLSSGWFINNADLIFLGNIGNFKESIGSYSSANKIIILMHTPAVLISLILNNYYLNIKDKNNWKLLNILIILYGIICNYIIYNNSFYIAERIFSEEIYQTSEYLKLLSFGIIPLVSFPLYLQILVLKNDRKYVTSVSTIIIICGIILYEQLLTKYGETGLCLAYILITYLSMILYGIRINKHKNFKLI